MNGRIYDPKLGRFLQADPFVDGATNAQGYNRYSYAHNNPLRYTDPSGYGILDSVLNIFKGGLNPVNILINTIITIGLDYLFNGDSSNSFLKTTESLNPGSSGGAYGNGAGVFGSRGSASAGVQSQAVHERVSGGTWSAQTGGKFANGADSSSFLSSYYGVSHNWAMPSLTPEEQIELYEDAIFVVEGIDITVTVVGAGVTIFTGGVASPGAWVAKIASKMGKEKFKRWAKRKIADLKKTTPRNSDTLEPGPYARESIPGHRGRPTAAEQQKIDELFEKHGCHTCGTKNPGTKTGKAVADHQPPQALDDPTDFYPHCLNCARRQGGQTLQEKIRRNQ